MGGREEKWGRGWTVGLKLDKMAPKKIYPRKKSTYILYLMAHV
jgi:hypothetical protein